MCSGQLSGDSRLCSDRSNSSTVPLFVLKIERGPQSSEQVWDRRVSVARASVREFIFLRAEEDETIFHIPGNKEDC